jgi:hypothetical protein
MALQIEDVDAAFPHRLALINHFDGLDRYEPGRPTVLGFDGLFELVRLNFFHAKRHVTLPAIDPGRPKPRHGWPLPRS